MCIGDRCLVIFLTYDIKKCYLSYVFSFIYDILRRIPTFLERHSTFFRGGACDATSEIKSSDVTFNAACELSQSIGKTEFSSTAKIEQTLSHR